MAEFLDLNNNCVKLSGLVDKISGDFVNDAVVSVTIKDGDTLLVTAQAMPYVAASDGVYRTVILSTVVMPDLVTVIVDAVAGDGSIYQSEDDDVAVRGRPLSGAT